jgi:hypothetical protein
MRSTATAAVASSLALLAGLVITPAASAVPIASGCDELNTPFWDGNFTTSRRTASYTFLAGETVVIVTSDPHLGTLPTSVEFQAPIDSVLVSGSPLGTMSYTFLADDTVAGMKTAARTGGADSGIVHWDVSCAFTGVPQASTPPRPWLQSYGRATPAEKCLETWHPSWAWWPHDNTGGWVCDRELAYNSSTGRWDAS